MTNEFKVTIKRNKKNTRNKKRYTKSEIKKKLLERGKKRTLLPAVASR
jgi:hypothetical protein